MKKIIKCMDVITKDEEREEADRLNKEFYEADQNQPKTENAEPEDDMELTPVEELSCRITDQLAFKTADRFADMVDGKAMDMIRQIIRHLDRTDSETAVGMLQAMFLLNGNADYAKELDIINLCAMYNECAYDDFIYELFDTTEFDWFMTEISMMEAFERSCPFGFVS